MNSTQNRIDVDEFIKIEAYEKAKELAEEVMGGDNSTEDELS